MSAQLLDLREELERIRSAGVDGVHIDIEDGVFVPVMGLGTRVVEAAAEWGGLPIDVHLMVSDPERALDLLGGVAVAAIAVHAESTRYPRRVLRLVRESGRRAGLAINPAGDVPDIAPLADHLDYVLMLTTEPEHTDPVFLPARLDAVARVAASARERGIDVVVDGGVDAGNVAAITAAGATGVVVGRALFGTSDLPAAVREIREAAA